MNDTQSTPPECKICSLCEQERPNLFFTDGAIHCSPCELQKSLRTETCIRCGKVKKASEGFQRKLDPPDYVCFECDPPSKTFLCAVCDRNKNANEFYGKYAHQYCSIIRRCIACFSCIRCHTEFTHAQNFREKDKICKACSPIFCEVCWKALPPHSFNVKNKRNKDNPDHYTRCIRCHVCTICNKAQTDENYDTVSKTCYKCSGELMCNVCSKIQKKISLSDRSTRTLGRRKPALALSALPPMQRMQKGNKYRGLRRYKCKLPNMLKYKDM